METKRHPKINVFLARFLEAFGNIDGASTERRRVREGHTFSSGSPRAALARAGLSNKNRQRRAWLQDLTRLEPLARRIRNKNVYVLM